MRKIIFDTETTGLNPEVDKIIEVGCVELLNDVPTGKTFHRYYNPDNVKISEQSFNIHGLSNDFLSKFPTFENSIEELLEFFGDSLLVIHNAIFDVSMVNHTLNKLQKNKLRENQYICTLEMSRKKFPGSKVNLNSLCRRYKINLESRQKHGALTDCFLLAQVYLELIGGKQRKIEFENNIKSLNNKIGENVNVEQKHYPKLTIRLSKQDENNHQEMLKKIKNSVWEKI